jgi:hypothetical protein
MSKYDWEAIERDYRAGHLSIRHLAAKHGIPESTVRSKANSLGWERDLTDAVRTATRAKLARSSRTDLAHGDDAQIVQEASDDAAAIVEAHRKAIGQWRRIAERLAQHLATMEVSDDNHDKYARSLNAGIDAMMKLVKGERQAYQLDEEQPADSENPYAHLSDEELHERINELTRKLGYAKSGD